MTTTTTTTTARRAILTRLADCAVSEQTTVCHGWEGLAVLVVEDDGAHIELSAHDCDGEIATKDNDGDPIDLNDIDTDEIEDAIRDLFAGADDVKVEIDWRENKGVVNVTVATRTTPRDGDGGGIHYRATSRFGKDDLSVGDAGTWADGVRLAPLVEDARAGKSITGYDGAVDEQSEQDARDALLRLAAALGA